MKKYIIIALVSGTVLTSCGEYNKVLKSTDYEYKYEAAKSYFGKGQNTKAATILEELITIMKGTEPIMKVEIETPEDYMGDVIGDLNRRRGMVEGMDDLQG